MKEDFVNDRVPPPEEDDESLREYGRQLAMDNILELALRLSPREQKALPVGKSPKEIRRGRRWRSRLLTASVAVVAVSLLLIVGATKWWRSPKEQPIAQLPPVPRENPARLEASTPLPPAPANRALPPKEVVASPAIKLPSGWIAEPTGTVDCRTLAADRLRLERGELRVYRAASSATAEDLPSITIETPCGTVTAKGTEFYIGVHALKTIADASKTTYQDSQKPSPPAPLPKGEGSVVEKNKTGDGAMFHMTRVLILTGVVSLSTTAGAIDGGAGSLLAAESGKPPVNVAVKANSQFAVDMYRQLARENGEKNLFFSPYSLSAALAMTAEGARGQTADEMGKVLGFPAEARRVGNDAQLIPWNIALIHTGMGELNTRFNPDRPELQPMREKIAKLRKELDETNRQAAGEKDEQKHDALARKSQQLANEVNQLLTQVDQYEIRVANALWGEKTFPFRKDYLETIHKFYNTGGIFSLDFKANSEAARRQINGWVEKQTNNRIQNLIAEGVLTPDARLVLTNAIYFKGEWAAKFEPSQTRDGDFHLADGGKKSTPMMHYDYNWSTTYAAFNADGTFFQTPEKYNPKKNDRQLYPAAGGFTMCELPYKGGELSLVMILPQEADGLKNLEEKLTGANLQSWIEKLQGRSVHVAMPKYRLEEEYPLNDTLQAIGMKRAFLDPGLNPAGAQFDGLCADDDPMHKLYLGAVFHKAFLDVSEKGTEAAAATYALMPAPMSMAPEPEELEPFIPRFQADKPFVFLIRDKKSGSILFLGRVLKP